MKLELDLTLDELNLIKKLCEACIKDNLEYNSTLFADDEDISYTSAAQTAKENSLEIFNCSSILDKLK
uniref:Uncharacterized protein n=1 Tax=Dulem virus 51 TaxID=3145762 RepID=A0AAU8AWS0_9VIRU